MARDSATGNAPTPAREMARELDRLLGRQLARIRNRFLLHGIGWLVGAACVGMLVYFAIDHSLRLPGLVRLVVTTGALFLLGLGLRRHVLYPMGRALSRDDAAIAVERVFPELRQKLISAHQLKQLLDDDGGDQALRSRSPALRNQSAAMIERVLADAAQASRNLPLQRVLDSRQTGRLWGLSATVTVLLLVGAALQPAITAVFLQRMFGLPVSYPRATTLVLELPPDGSEVRRVDRGNEVELTLAAGSDLHVNVRAEGAVPREVFLEVDSDSGSRRLAMNSRPGGRFRAVFRGIQEGFSFHASGGDDEYGDKFVTVRTINPPLVAEIRATLTPPAYTQEESVEQLGGNIEALVGTAVQLEVTATAAVQTAKLEFIESGLQIDLRPATVQDDSGRSLVYQGRFTVSDSDRYRIQLVGEPGLGNPHPGTYPITALEDFAPVGRMLNPDDEGMDYLLPTGVLAVRVEARDDYGLTSATLHVEVGQSRSDVPLWQEQGEDSPMLRGLFIRLMEVANLLAESRAGQEGLLLTGELRDNREPEASVTELPRRQVQIVDEGQLASAISRHFRATREEVEKALDLQSDRMDRLEQVREELEGGASPKSLTHSLTGIEVGQGRIQTTAERVHRQLMRAFDLHLFNRQEPDPNAEQVLQLYGQWHRQNPQTRSFVPGFYREVVAQRRSGRLGAMETILDPILAMLETADRLATESTPLAVRQITRAQVAPDGAALTQILDETLPLQARILADWQSLLERLDEWNEFQDVIQETRALRDRQRDIQNRTETIQGKR